MKRIIQGLALVALVSAAQASYGSSFPADGEPTSVPVAWTYADRHAGGSDQRVGSAFAANGEEKSVPVASTYADQHAGEIQSDTLVARFPRTEKQSRSRLRRPTPIGYAGEADQRTAALSN